MDAGQDRRVTEGDTVVLGGTAADPDMDALTYSWTSDHPGLAIAAGSTLAPSFVAPGVGSDTIITFTLAASDGEYTVTDTVRVTVADAPPPDIPMLINTIENLTDIVEGLVLKITALEATVVDLRGTLGWRAAPPTADSGDFVPIYYGATSGSNLAQKSHYEDRSFLENFTGRLAQALALPHDVYLAMDECGEPGAAYYRDYKRIVICYEFVTFLEGRLTPYSGTDAELSRDVDGFVTWVMLHEIGHALIDVYDLPITGIEEDAVDQFAAVIALEYIPPDQAGNVLYPALLAWSSGQSGVFPAEGQPAGHHSLTAQRFHDMACWMYGSDAHAHSGLAGGNILLPEEGGEGARQCQSEYERMSGNWHRLVSPFLIGPGPVQPP